MDREDFFYEMAFREIETGELDKATWAKAFSLSTDDEHAKKLYIQYRVEQNINAPEAYVPDANNTDPEISKEQEPQLVQEPLPESKASSWLDSFVNIILIVPPVYLAGAWLISLDKGGPNPLGVLIPTMDNGATWFTVLWPFALVYWLLKRSKDKGKHELSPLMRGEYNWGIFSLVAVGLALFFSVNQASYKPINDEISLSPPKSSEILQIHSSFEKDISFTRALSNVRKNIPKFPSNLSDFRDVYKEYDDLANQEVVDAIYTKYFSSLSKSEFSRNWGFMNVTLPNGRVIENVPVGTSQRVLAVKAISNGIATAEDFENLICFEDKYNETWICSAR